jgi:hypothetical protein
MPQLLLGRPTSNSSVMRSGGLIVLPVVMPKKPTTRSPASVVVIDGAAHDVLSGVKAPLWESTGIEMSAPLTSRIAPALETDESKDHV